MAIDKEMLNENEMDGYVKVDKYNPKSIQLIASRYNDILKEIE